SAAINGQRSGAGWGNGGAWDSATSGHFPEWVQGDFAARYSISQVNVFSVQDNFTSPIEPTSTQTFTAFGVTSFEVQYWTGTAWVTIPGTTVTGNNLVWRTVSFTPVTTQKIRVVVNGSPDGYSRLTEGEAYAVGTTPPPPPPPSGGTNVALASAGAGARASSTDAAGVGALGGGQAGGGGGGGGEA